MITCNINHCPSFHYKNHRLDNQIHRQESKFPPTIFHQSVRRAHRAPQLFPTGTVSSPRFLNLRLTNNVYTCNIFSVCAYSFKILGCLEPARGIQRFPAAERFQKRWVNLPPMFRQSCFSIKVQGLRNPVTFQHLIFLEIYFVKRFGIERRMNPYRIDSCA